MGGGGGVPLLRLNDTKSPASEVSNFSLPRSCHYRWAIASFGPTSGSTAAPGGRCYSSPPGPGAAAGRAGQGAPGAARLLLEEAWRAAARGCAPVCVQSGSAGCAPSRAAMRKQTHGNSSAPSARSPRARRRRRRCRLRSPRARPPGRPPPPPAPLAPPAAPPRPRRRGLPHLPPHARALAHHAPRAARPDRGLRRAR